MLDATLEPAAGRDALLVVADSALLDLGERIAGLALRHRLPTFSSIPEFTDAGALVGYGPSRRDSYRRAATYVKKVLEGAKPAAIPVEQPTRIELSINMRTARAQARYSGSAHTCGAGSNSSERPPWHLAALTCATASTVGESRRIPGASVGQPTNPRRHSEPPVRFTLGAVGTPQPP
jgi:hypothetical protein